MKRQPRRAGGFTLVEAVLVIVIIGILGAIVAVFIRAPILGYRDAVARAELTDQADLALRRIARDIRLALPNSVRVTGDGAMLELLLTRSGGRYLAADDGEAALPVLDFEQAGALQFTVVAPPASFGDVRPGDYVVVYNLGEGFEPANAYHAGVAGAQRNIARIAALAPHARQTINGADYPTTTVTLADNPFALQETAMQSPARRFQVVSSPVSYYCSARADGSLDLWRAWGYPIGATQGVPPLGERALLASGLDRCDHLFDYGTAASQLSALVTIDLGLRARDAGAGAIRLVHQVHVDNTP